MLLGVLRVRSHEDVTRMWVAVDEPRDEDLLREASDYVRDDGLLVESQFFQVLVVGHLDAVDPL